MSANTGFSEADERYMRRALELAERGRETVTPNPCVGALVVDETGIVGEGWHAKAGEPHAEIYALREAGDRAKGSTVYVTLEPCSHTGRTGPCVDALIDAEVHRVVFAMSDPNPQVGGEGARRLQAAGIAVDSGLLEASARALNAGFVRRMSRGRPLVTMKLAASLDGRSAMASGESQWITGELARANAQELRARSCAILTGRATISSDDPSYTVRPEALGRPVSRQPELWIADSDLQTPMESRVIRSLAHDDRRLVLLADGENTTQYQERLKQFEQAGAEVVACQSASAGGLDPSAMIAAAAESGINNLLVEAGAMLSGSLLAAGLVDEIVYYQAPVLLGSSARPAAELSIETLDAALRLEVIERQVLGDDMRWHLRVLKA